MPEMMAIEPRNDGNRTLLEPAKEHAYNDNDSAVTTIYRSSHPLEIFKNCPFPGGVTASV